MNRPPRGFLAQTVAAPAQSEPKRMGRPSLGDDEPMERAPLSPNENNSNGGQIRRLQEKIHSEFRAKPTPAVKSPDEEARKRTDSE
jgi:hypothetical protein